MNLLLFKSERKALITLVADLIETLNESEKILASRQTQIDSVLSQALDREEELKLQIQSLTNSFFWKITMPFRKSLDMVKIGLSKLSL